MRRYGFLLLSFFLVGCSYNLKTSLFDESSFSIEEKQNEASAHLENCEGSQYCVWQALYDISDFLSYESYLNSIEQNPEMETGLWDIYLQSKINYAAATPLECDALSNSDLKTRCRFAVKFNEFPDFDCTAQETGKNLCMEQEIFSRFPRNACLGLDGTEQKDECLVASALVTNDSKYCLDLWNDSDVDECQSVIGNSLYFCEDKECVDFYFDRNMPRKPRLVYCDFSEESLQKHCEGRIRDWFALSQQNFLYCPNKECYRLLIDKYHYFYPSHGADLVQSKACGHLTKEISKERCDSFVSDSLAVLSQDIQLCNSRDCFDAFRGNIAFGEEALCSVFMTSDEDLFALESAQMSYCVAVINHNKALVLSDDALCLDSHCLMAVKEQKESQDVFLEEVNENPEMLSKIDLSHCSDLVGPFCASLEVDGLETFADYKTACLAVEDSALLVGKGDCESYLLSLSPPLEEVSKEPIDIESLSLSPNGIDLSTLDVNEFAKTVDLNQAAKDLDLNRLRSQIDPLGLMDDIDLNSLVKDIDLNEVAADIDLNEALKGIDIKGISESLSPNEPQIEAPSSEE